jgi:hypothetical protein
MISKTMVHIVTLALFEMIATRKYELGQPINNCRRYNPMMHITRLLKGQLLEGEQGI